MLTKAANDGRKSIPSKCEWEGDDYFMKHMKCGEASMVRTIETPEQEKARITEEEETLLESKGETMSEKLILDQPDQVTVEGKVEQVMTVDAEVTLTEDGEEQPKDVLLNEDPLEGVEIILD